MPVAKFWFLESGASFCNKWVTLEVRPSGALEGGAGKAAKKKWILAPPQTLPAHQLPSPYCGSLPVSQGQILESHTELSWAGRTSLSAAAAFAWEKAWRVLRIVDDTPSAFVLF